MNIEKQIQLIQIKSYYQQNIELIINAATDHLGGIDTDKAKSSILHLWFCHFQHNNADLEKNVIDTIWNLFDSAMNNLDAYQLLQNTERQVHQHA